VNGRLIVPGRRFFYDKTQSVRHSKNLDKSTKRKGETEGVYGRHIPIEKASVERLGLWNQLSWVTNIRKQKRSRTIEHPMDLAKEGK